MNSITVLRMGPGSFPRAEAERYPLGSENLKSVKIWKIYLDFWRNYQQMARFLSFLSFSNVFNFPTYNCNYNIGMFLTYKDLAKKSPENYPQIIYPTFQIFRASICSMSSLPVYTLRLHMAAPISYHYYLKVLKYIWQTWIRKRMKIDNQWLMIKDTKLSALKLGGDGGPSCQSFTLRKKAGQHHYHKGLPLL